MVSYWLVLPEILGRKDGPSGTVWHAAPATAHASCQDLFQPTEVPLYKVLSPTQSHVCKRPTTSGHIRRQEALVRSP